MTNRDKYLLPPGFRDCTNNEAEVEFWALSKILDNFSKWSYKKVSTPLLEYSDSLFANTGEALTGKTMQLVDPQTQKAMGIRSDITTQISRLVESRLNKQELPLRLCYYGDIIRKSASNTKGDRQLKQVGLELISDKDSYLADAEVIIIAMESLLEVGLSGITLDLNTPGLMKKLGEYSEEQIKSFLKRDIESLPEELQQLVKFSGNAKNALEINTSNMPEAAKQQIEHLKQVYQEIDKTGLDINITIDFVEDKGFEYQENLGFSFFAKGTKDEIGRGGRYTTNQLFGCGFTLYINSFIDSLKTERQSEVVTITPQTPYEEIKNIKNSGKTIKKLL